MLLTLHYSEMSITILAKLIAWRDFACQLHFTTKLSFLQGDLPIRLCSPPPWMSHERLHLLHISSTTPFPTIASQIKLVLVDGCI